jgi:hypothetical protein
MKKRRIFTESERLDIMEEYLYARFPDYDSFKEEWKDENLYTRAYEEKEYNEVKSSGPIRFGYNKEGKFCKVDEEGNEIQEEN